jgi:hypothetical protein
MTEEYPEPRQERREKRKTAREARMQKHGKGLGSVYRNAVVKRAKASGDNRSAKS